MKEEQLNALRQQDNALREDLAAVAVDGLLLCLGTLFAQSLYQVCLGHAVFCLCLYIRRK